MGHSHNHTHATDNTALGKKQARALKGVMAINGVMLAVELVAGYISRSTAVFADTLDMLGDTVSAGTAVALNKKSKKVQSWAALGKAAFLLLAGGAVLAEAAFKLVNPVMPSLLLMTVVGGMAFTANAASVKLLWKYRKDNINIQSTFACVRNDMVSSLLVPAAAGLAYLTASPLPDIIIGGAVAALFTKSAISIGREAIRNLRGKDGGHSHDGHACAHDHHHHGPAPKVLLKLKNALAKKFNRKAKKEAEKAKAPKPAPVQTPQPPTA